MKAILFVISDDTYLLSHRFSLIKKLVLKGYQVSALTKITSLKNQKTIEDAGCQVFDVGYRSSGMGVFGNIKLFLKYIYFFNKIKPEIIQVVSIRTVLIGLCAFYCSSAKKFVGTITGLGYLATSTSWVIKLIKNIVFAIFRLLLNSKNTFLIVQNKDDYIFCSRHLINKNRLRLIRGSGVDVNYFVQQPEVQEKKIVIAFVARLLKDKGVVEAVNAVKNMATEYPNIELHLVGDVFLENPQSLNKSEIIKLTDHPNIKWLGFQSDILAVWKSSHIALLPSYREGLPKSLLEAAACGRPIVTTDVPGCREIVNNNDNGFLVPAKSIEALIPPLKTLIENASLRKSMGEQSRRLVESNFSDEIINQQVLALYESFN